MSTSELSQRLAALTAKKEAPKMVSRKQSIGRAVAKSAGYAAFKRGATSGFSFTFKDEEGAGEGAGEGTGETPAAGSEETPAAVDGHAASLSWLLGRTESGVEPWATQILPGIQNEVLEDEQRIIALMNTYAVSTPWVKYRRLTEYTRGAAVVPEKGKKPSSSLELDEGEATTHTVAVTFNLTNQEIRDDAALVNLVDGLLRMDLREKLSKLALSGTGSGEPLGLLSDPDMVVAVRKARDLLRRDIAPGSPTLALSVEDAQALDLMRLTSNAYMYAGAPYGPGNVPTLWGLPIVVTSELTQGTALLAKFGAFDVRVREGIKVEAFEQHADYATHNLTLVRAEMDAGTMHRFPKAAVSITLP